MKERVGGRQRYLSFLLLWETSANRDLRQPVLHRFLVVGKPNTKVNAEKKESPGSHSPRSRLFIAFSFQGMKQAPESSYFFHNFTCVKCIRYVRVRDGGEVAWTWRRSQFFSKLRTREEYLLSLQDRRCFKGASCKWSNRHTGVYFISGVQ